MSRALDSNVLLQCKTAYLADETKSVLAIARLYNVNGKTLTGWAQREDWAGVRRSIKNRTNKRIVAEIERNVPREIVKVIKQRILHGAGKALDTLELVIDGKAGKGAYNRLLASKEWLYMGGFKAPDQMDIKVSKVSDMLERVSIKVNDIPAHALQAGEVGGSSGLLGGEGAGTGVGGEAEGRAGGVQGGEGSSVANIPSLTGGEKEVLGSGGE